MRVRAVKDNELSGTGSIVSTWFVLSALSQRRYRSYIELGTENGSEIEQDNDKIIKKWHCILQFCRRPFSQWDTLFLFDAIHCFLAPSISCGSHNLPCRNHNIFNNPSYSIQPQKKKASHAYVLQENFIFLSLNR